MRASLSDFPLHDLRANDCDGGLALEVDALSAVGLGERFPGVMEPLYELRDLPGQEAAKEETVRFVAKFILRPRTAACQEVVVQRTWGVGQLGTADVLRRD